MTELLKLLTDAVVLIDVVLAFFDKAGLDAVVCVSWEVVEAVPDGGRMRCDMVPTLMATVGGFAFCKVSLVGLTGLLAICRLTFAKVS